MALEQGGSVTNEGPGLAVRWVGSCVCCHPCGCQQSQACGYVIIEACLYVTFLLWDLRHPPLE